ncbi:MAG: aminotransferase class V-fold PLP-dependent enzyme [Dehalococcoidia bacterium]|nr:aminotransferase class V-fold PLP-dependent enzyme [Dehalococcoidia bacterium]
MNIETIAVHSGRSVDPVTGAITPPIHMSTTFEREADGSYPHGFVYGRSGNPSRKLLEECVRDLEGGVAAAAFGSGMAAIMSVFQSLSPGDHVIAPRDIYHGTARLLREVMARWNLDTSFVDMTDIDVVRQAIIPSTRLLIVETPSNPLLKITDVAAMTEVARQRGITCLCDNTWASPALQRCIDLGADLVVHSTTKYLGGHGDVTGGIVVSARQDGLFEEIGRIQQQGGAVPSPFDCWLILRGIRTLPYRMRAHSESAAKVATFLDGHPKVLEVYYPGLKGHPGHDIARRQMDLFGGMLSFRVQGGREAAFRVAAGTSLFVRATSLGSYESLIEHRASIEGPESGTPDDLLRVSVGLENADDLISDLEQALTAGG